jgi:hypothetical protein
MLFAPLRRLTRLCLTVSGARISRFGIIGDVKRLYGGFEQTY